MRLTFETFKYWAFGCQNIFSIYVYVEQGTLIKILVENLMSSVLVSMETVSLIAFQI